jgi:hypothetical protein
MDPYLEDPVVWPGVHGLLIAAAGTALNRLIRPRYVARIEERVYVVRPRRELIPDVSVQRPAAATRRKSRAETGTATVPASDPCWEIALEPSEVREVYLQIRPARSRTEVVTVVEILSPTNKLAGSEGRQSYLEKQRQVLASPVHLLEIDLLRQGEHTVVASPPDLLAGCGTYDYLVCLSRADQRSVCQVWGFTLRQRLPRVRVPLAADEEDVVLDLQEVLDRVYDEGAYADDTDYTLDPVVPLRQADAEWTDALLREKGLRKKRRKPRSPNGN